ncbi:MAG: GNAT family N-acetyltransferase [Eubacteriales bacterium]|nr:GNAT family N-acetyltransferase [Eubacteriales bacterium]
MTNWKVKTGFDNMDAPAVCRLLENTYWAREHPKDVMLRAMQNSRCYGVFDEQDRQIGFARAVTDDATVFYLADVVVEEACRGRGAGRALMTAVANDPALKGLRGLLVTLDAHGLYEPYGFVRSGPSFMMKKPEAWNDAKGNPFAAPVGGMCYNK